MVTKIKTKTTGLKNENQTEVLKGVNNGEINNDTTTITNLETPLEEYQNVLIHSDRSVVIRMVNNILKNVGEKRQLSSKDNSEKLCKTIDYVAYNYSIKLQYLLGKEEIYQLTNDNYGTVESLYIMKVDKDNWITSFRVDTGNKEMWSKIIKQYPNSEWIVDHYYIDNECFCIKSDWDGQIYTGSTLMENKGGNIQISYHSFKDIDILEELYPGHFGYIRNDCMYVDLEIDKWYIEELRNCDYPVRTSMKHNEGIYVKNRKEYTMEISKKDKQYIVKNYQWYGLLRYLKDKEISKINQIDCFIPYYQLLYCIVIEE